MIPQSIMEAVQDALDAGKEELSDNQLNIIKAHIDHFLANKFDSEIQNARTSDMQADHLTDLFFNITAIHP